MTRLRPYLAGIAAVIGGSLAAAADAETDLLKRAQELFRPLPQEVASTDAGIVEDRAALGRLLFFDPRLTIDGNVSCSTCHQPARYGTEGLATSRGIRGRPHPRNAPTILNVGLLPIVHWRGDRESLEDQVAKALSSPITSGQPNEQAVVDRLERIPDYTPLFKAAFPNDATPFSGPNIAKAIAAYERTLVTPAPFDRYLAGDVEALSLQARSGLETFMSVGCATCHNGVLVGGGSFRKFGVFEDYWKATGSQAIDKGRADVTKNPDDLYVFRVASLRNVAMTAPYFHDGSVPSLPEAAQVMARVQLGAMLSNAQTSGIVAFLESLTGELPANFATAPSLPADTDAVGRRP